MEQAVRHDSYLGFLTKAVRRHVLLVMVVLLLGIAGAIAYIQVTPVSYTATATVLPRPLLGNPLGPDISTSSSTQQTVAMLTEASLVGTPAVADLASTSLGTTVPRPQDKVSATVPPSTQIIKIIYRSNSALHAQQGAQAFAKAFLDYREAVSLTNRHQTLVSLGKQRAITEEALRHASDLVNPGSDPRSFEAQQQLLYSNQLTTLENKISVAKALSTDPGVITSASKPGIRDGLKPYVIVIVGAILALVLGLVLAGARERRRDVVDSGIEHDVNGLPLLATLPQGNSKARRLITDHQADDALPEAYRRMRAGFIAVSGKLKVIAISGVSAETTSGAVAVNLGISLAQAGFRVTVVATDGSDRTAETMLHAEPSPGLADVLLSQTDLGDALQEIHGIWFLSAGRDTSKARELYAGPALKSVIRELDMESDFVIVASAGLSAPDADSVALVCDGVVLVVSREITTHAETAAAIESYENLHVTRVGAVSLTDDDPDG